jgi:predicted DNA-binding transcriptional regulator AlpA
MRASANASQPTLDEIRAWPAAIDVPTAGHALGLSRSHAYALVTRGEFPARVIRAGGRYRVVTASLLTLLSHPTPHEDAI